MQNWLNFKSYIPLASQWWSSLLLLLKYRLFQIRSTVMSQETLIQRGRKTETRKSGDHGAFKMSELKISFIFSVRDATVPKLHSATSEAKIISHGEFKVSLYNNLLSFILLLFPFPLVSAQTKVTYSKFWYLDKQKNNAKTHGAHFKKCGNLVDACI